MIKTVCVVTGSRADYGLLKPLLDEIKSDKQLDLQLVVTGAHLSADFGFTYKEIEKDGFSIDKKIDIQLDADTSMGISRSMGLAVKGFAGAFALLRPDVVVVLGDRFEIFGAVIAAFVGRLPIAHISGGEVTEGVLDEAFRHSITKMSYLHFTSTAGYRRRVIQLGEEPKRAFNVGALGADNAKRLKLLSKEELEKELGFKFNKRNLLVTFHPVTLEKDAFDSQICNLFRALDGLKDTEIIFTKANADIGGKGINKMIDTYVAKNRHRAVSFTSLGRARYLSFMRHVDAVVGNSSSGITEAPIFKIGTVNIGDRQRGRIKPKSIIDCKPTYLDIKNSIHKVYSHGFQKTLKNIKNPYGDGNAAARIVSILKKANIEDVLKKKFHDIGANGRSSKK